MKEDIKNYDTFIVYFSGGKDSLACVLHLLDIGVNKSKIELWHHEVDGKEGSTLMDWPITPAYCQAVADALGIPLYFSWKVGGFEREMLRENQLTAPTKFECPDGEVKEIGGKRGKPSTRRKFPQVSANLSVRWCSAYLKIDVGAAALRNQKRFNNSKTITISGERSEESASRAKYKTFEPDRTDNREGKTKRHVDRWRPVHSWSEQEVWAIIERYKINPHPAYHLGWGRLSCQFCIFGNCNQWTSGKSVSPDRFKKVSEYEKEFEITINRSKNLQELMIDGNIYNAASNGYVEIANQKEFSQKIIIENWLLPAGAFGESSGPS